MNHTSARGFTVGASLVTLAAAILLAASPARAQTTGGSCDRVCLTGVMDTYLTAMAAQTPEKVPLAPGAIIFENIKPIALNASRWQNVTGLKSTTSFADPQTGNIVSRAAATNKDGAILYIGTRLKVTGKKIAEVETSFNERPISGVEAANVVTYDPIYDTIVPPRQADDACRVGTDRPRRISTLSARRSPTQPTTTCGAIASAPAIA